jgi:hypothetical protein
MFHHPVELPTGRRIYWSELLEEDPADGTVQTG